MSCVLHVCYVRHVFVYVNNDRHVCMLCAHGHHVCFLRTVCMSGTHAASVIYAIHGRSQRVFTMYVLGVRDLFVLRMIVVYARSV